MIKKIIKKILDEYNILNYLRKRNMKRKLKNINPTLLCPNCMGGILFHDLGLKFQSPTINTMILQTDFIKFVTNLDYYCDQNLVFFKHDKYSFPCATLGDIVIHFTHYTSEEEAAEKWYERCSRINSENLFIVCSERDGVQKEDILKLKNVKARGIVVFTYNKYPDIPYACYIKKYRNNGEVGNILKKNYITGSHEYESLFDFIKWFNLSNGKKFDISEFVK